MAKRRNSKNLVAGLTVAGMVLSIGAVGVVAMQSARRDPAVYVAKAQAAMEKGDLKRAGDLYWRAWATGKEPASAISAAHCMFELGEPGRAMLWLNQAHAALPDAAALVEASIEKLLELEAYRVPVATELRDRSAELLEIDPNNVLGLVARVKALRFFAGVDPRNPELAQEALDKAVQVDPTNRHVAILRAQQIISKSSNLPRDASYPAELNKIGEEALTVLKAALAKNAGDFNLIDEIGRIYLYLRRLDELHDFLKDVAAATSDARLEQRLADALWRLALREREKPEGTRDANLVAARLAEAAQHAARAIELDPLSYDAYSTAARIEIAHVVGRELRDEDVARYEKAFDLIDTSLDKTVGARALRVKLADGSAARVFVLSEAFEHAGGMLARSTKPEQREKALAHARRYVERALTQYANVFITASMEGELAIFENKPREAVAAFERADELTSADATVPAQYKRHIQGRLGLLYQQLGQPGLARRHTERAMTTFEKDGLTPPVQLWTNLVQALLVANDFDKALNAAEVARGHYPEDAQLKRLRAAALVKLGRASEAETDFGSGGAEDVGWLMFSTRQALLDQDYGKAEMLLERVLEAEPENMEALGMYSSVMVRAEKNQAGAAKLKALRERSADERVKRQIDTYLVSLEAATPEERDARLLEIIKTNSDPFARASEYHSFYAARDNHEQAGKQLDEMEKLRPQEPLVLYYQMERWLREKKIEAAEEYAVKLGRLNADKAGGATYRARIKLARGDSEGALTEFYAAQRTLPSDANLQVWIARTLLSFERPRLEEALGALQLAVDYDPTDYAANQLLFVVYEQLGRRNEGVPYLERAAAQRPNDEFIRQNMRLLEEERNPQAGIARRESERQAKPDDMPNLVRLAELYSKVATDSKTKDDARARALAKGVEVLNAAAALEPANPSIGPVAALLFTTADQRAEGEQFLRRCIEARSELARVEGLLLLARFLERMKDPAAAQAELVRADEFARDQIADADARKHARAATSLELVRFLGRSEQYELVPDAVEKALSTVVEPQQTITLQLTLFDALLRLKRFGEAGDVIKKYCAEHADDLRGPLGQAQLLMSMPQPGPDERMAALSEARELLTRTLEKRSDEPMALYLRGQATVDLVRNHGQRQLVQAAIEDLRRCKQLRPDGFQMGHRLSLFDAYDLSGATALAEAELKELLELRPDDRATLARLIRFYRSHGQGHKSQEYFTQRAARDPNNPVWSHQLGRLLLEAREYSTAVRPLSEAMTKYQQTGQVPGLVMTDVMEALTRAKRPGDALSFYERITQQGVKPMPRMLAFVGECHLQQSAREKAHEMLESALVAGVSSDPGELSSVANIVSQAVPPAESAALFQRAVAATADKPGHLMLVALAASYMVEESASRTTAKEYIDRILKDGKPGSLLHLSAMQVRARLSDLEGNADQAIADLKAILEVNQNHIEALNNLAYKLADDMGRAAEALPYAERLREVIADAVAQGNLTLDMQVNAFDTIGYVYLLADKVPAAENMLQEALRLDPGHVAGHLHLAQVYIKQGRTAESRQLLEKGRDLAKEKREEQYRSRIEALLRGA